MNEEAMAATTPENVPEAAPAVVPDSVAESQTPPHENDTEKEAIIKALEKEYPLYVKDGKPAIPPEVAALQNGGMGLLEACRLDDLNRTREQCRCLEARVGALVGALEESRLNGQRTIGSAAGGEAPEKDYYTPQEWDSLPGEAKQRFIKSGRIYEFMKKWSGNR